jgi:hypothetical protein
MPTWNGFEAHETRRVISRGPGIQGYVQRGDDADLANTLPMLLLLVPALVALWLFVVVTAIALCAQGRRIDEQGERELAQVIDIRSAA